jgi:hypothetical protein
VQDLGLELGGRREGDIQGRSSARTSVAPSRLPREMRARLAQAAALVGGILLLATPASARDVFTVFKTPSGNIGCAYSWFSGETPYLRCDIRSGLVPRPPKPNGCDLDWGYGYEMRSVGQAHSFCAGDTALDPRARVLAYGSRWSRGGFTCVSRTTGLTCRNRSGHGFLLSRARSRTL